MSPAGRMATALLLTAVAAGCVPSRPLRPGELDQMWTPAPSAWPQAQPARPTINGASLPHRYEAAYEPSDLWSMIQMHHEAALFPQDGDKIVFPLSTRYARAQAQMFSDLADNVSRMAAALELANASPGDRERWASTLAELIARIHHIFAMAYPDPAVRQRMTVADTAVWSALPVLQVFTRTVAPEGAGTAERLALLEQAEASLVRVLLTASFRITGRRLDLSAVREVLQIQRTQAPPRAVENTRAVLLWHFHATPRRFESIPAAARGMSQYARHIADGMAYLARQSRQWEKMEYLAMELRRTGDQRIAALEFHVRPGERVVLSNLDFLAPDLEFTGQGRIVFQQALPQSERREEKHFLVLFESDNGGAMTFRFRGLPYALVRLLGFPLQDARLRQLQILLYHNPQGQDVRRIILLMEALRPVGGDTRQIISIDTVRQPVLQPRQSLPPRLEGRLQVRRFTFANGERIWQTIRRDLDRPELWRGRP